jgi:phospholipid transport system transporter-binding protein
MKLAEPRMTNDNARRLLAAGEAAIAAGDFEFDLSGVTEIDSAAVALLLEWQRCAIAQGGSIRLSGVPASLRGLAALYGVEALLPLNGAQQEH